jgi:RNA polymerase sigma-70 factor (ECF subfamily)
MRFDPIPCDSDEPQRGLPVLDLVGRARAGDRDAFGTLAAASIDRLYALAVRVIHDRDRAEDAVQSALLQAWLDLPSLRDPGRFDAWLYRLVVRACYDEARRQRAHTANVSFVSVEPGEPDGSGHFADRDQLERAFRRLPIEQRAVIVLHHYEALPLTEVAEALGIPVGTARSRLHYALRTLRGAIEADERPVVSEGRTA